MKRTIAVSLLFGLLTLGSLAVAGDTQNTADSCPLGCCSGTSCCSTSCEISE